jgi:hypothetical protein
MLLAFPPKKKCSINHKKYFIYIFSNSPLRTAALKFFFSKFRNSHGNRMKLSYGLGSV